MTVPVLPSGSLADGEWHRLHPMTPLLRGGLAFIAIIGVIVVNLRDVWIEFIIGDVIGEGPDSDDSEFVGRVVTGPWFGPALGGAALLLLIVVAFLWLSWRMHTFRVTDELVEVRSGVLFRTHRRGRLDRIQGINVARPFLARLVGAAKLDVAVAGQDGNIRLEFLGSKPADALRADILRLASAVKASETGAAPTGTPAATGASAFVNDRVNELLAPELDPSLAPPESVVKMHAGRLAGSILLSMMTLIGIAVIIGVVIVISVTREYFVLLTIIPILIAFVGTGISRFTKSLRYSIAGTDDGVRVGFGLLSTSNDTIPPGRIHAVHVHQPLLWRPFGWWAMTISRATSQSMDSSGARPSTSLLPVGDLDDVRRVLALVLPALPPEDTDALIAGIIGSGEAHGFTISPPRARIVRWFSRRRNGLAMASSAVLMRTGAIWRQVTIVPLARIQSVAISRGPLARAQRLAGIDVHVVGALPTAHLGALDEQDAAAWFTRIADGARDAIAADRSDRWNEPAETP